MPFYALALSNALLCGAGVPQPVGVSGGGEGAWDWIWVGLEWARPNKGISSFGFCPLVRGGVSALSVACEG
jgi:hypothetical protein